MQDRYGLFESSRKIARGGKKRAPDASGRITEIYRSFMQSYVRRINDESFKVTIGGVRIGSAKQSRLAQINLQSRIITFSRYAIQNVPERGRRYLVLHELAHVLEGSHNKHFWDLVSTFEPDHKEVGAVLDRAFKRNVMEDAAETVDSVMSRLNLNAASGLIWTPDYGFVESGNAALGLDRDPLSSFSPPSDALDEAFDDYLEMQESPDIIEEDFCFDDNYLDDCTDDFFGTMTGGE